MRADELLFQKRQTQAFVGADEFDVTFERIFETADGLGGRTETVEQLPPQRVRIIPSKTRSASLTYTRPTGEVISSKDLLLIGDPDLDVQMTDTFTWQGQGFQISYIETNREYQTVCQVDQLGETERSTV